MELTLVGAAFTVGVLAKTNVLRIEKGPNPLSDVALTLYWTSESWVKPVWVYWSVLMSEIVAMLAQAGSG